MIKYDTIVSLSGGLDSVVLLHERVRAKRPLRALYLNFAKRPSPRELSSAKFHALSLGVPLEIVDTRGLTSMTLGFAAIADQIADELDVKEYESGDGLPLRRSRSDQARVSGFYVLLAITAYYAQIIGAKRIAFAITREQVQQFPAIGRSFTAFRQGIELMNPEAGPLAVETPLAKMTKAAIVKRGHRLGVPLDSTWSCLLGSIAHCGRCGQCKSRREAFASAGVQDATVYMDDRDDLEFLR